MSKKLWASTLTGGSSGALDAINPADVVGDASNIALEAGDICEVILESTIHTYIAISSAGAVEKVPDIIIPDTNPGNFWWKLIHTSNRTDGMIDALMYQMIPGGF